MGFGVVVCGSYGVRKLPASLSKKMEQKTPGTLIACTVVPHDVHAVFRELLVIGVTWMVHMT